MKNGVAEGVASDPHDPTEKYMPDVTLCKDLPRYFCSSSFDFQVDEDMKKELGHLRSLLIWQPQVKLRVSQIIVVNVQTGKSMLVPSFSG